MPTRALNRAFTRMLSGRVSTAALRAWAYAATMFASSAMNNLFVTYYIDLFTNVVRLSSTWFYVGQTVFMLWNSINDPLFGWISDNMSSGGAGSSPRSSGGDGLQRAPGLHRRTAAIGNGGLFWAAAFAFVWWPWAIHQEPPTPGDMVNEPSFWSPSAVLAGLHFIVSLCTYDGLLTFVEVNHSALLAEMTLSATERARANMMAGLAAAVGSGTSFLAYLVYDRNHLGPFRAVVLVLAITCVLTFKFSAWGVALVSAPDSPSVASSSSTLSSKRFGFSVTTTTTTTASGGSAASRTAAPLAPPPQLPAAAAATPVPVLDAAVGDVDDLGIDLPPAAALANLELTDHIVKHRTATSASGGHGSGPGTPARGGSLRDLTALAAAGVGQRSPQAASGAAPLAVAAAGSTSIALVPFCGGDGMGVSSASGDGAAASGGAQRAPAARLTPDASTGTGGISFSIEPESLAAATVTISHHDRGFLDAEEVFGPPPTRMPVGPPLGSSGGRRRLHDHSGTGASGGARSSIGGGAPLPPPACLGCGGGVPCSLHHDDHADDDDDRHDRYETSFASGGSSSTGSGSSLHHRHHHDDGSGGEGIAMTPLGSSGGGSSSSAAGSISPQSLALTLPPGLASPAGGHDSGTSGGAGSAAGSGSATSGGGSGGVLRQAVVLATSVMGGWSLALGAAMVRKMGVRAALATAVAATRAAFRRTFYRRKARPGHGHGATGEVSYWRFLRQLLSSRSVLVFVVIASLQTFDCTFEKNFYAPFMDALTSPMAMATGAGGSGGGLVGGGAGGGSGGGSNFFSFWLSDGLRPRGAVPVAFHGTGGGSHSHGGAPAVSGAAAAPLPAGAAGGGVGGDADWAAAGGLLGSHEDDGHTYHDHADTLRGVLLHPLLHRQQPKTQAAAILEGMKRNADAGPGDVKFAIPSPTVPAPPSIVEAPAPAAAAAAAAQPAPVAAAAGGVQGRRLLDTGGGSGGMHFPLHMPEHGAVTPLTPAEEEAALAAEAAALEAAAARAEALAPSSAVRAAFISLSFLLPHALTVLWTPFIATRGLHTTLQAIFGIRLLVLAVAAFVGRANAYAVMIFMLLNRVLSESVCRLYPLVLSDLVDEDIARHMRPKTLSASLVGSVSFVSKFGQSLAPLLAFSFLPRDLGFPPSGSPSSAIAESSHTPEVIWTLLLLVPLLCVVIQLALWSSCYALRGQYLLLVKQKAAQHVLNTPALTL